jgi:acyl-CoA synthetase (AMP-forming)/AMP-acid ligase II
MKTFFIGVEALQRSLVTKLMKRFPDAEIWHGYGPTEVTCLTIVITPSLTLGNFAQYRLVSLALPGSIHE